MILRKKMRKKRDKLDKQIPKLDELLKRASITLLKSCTPLNSKTCAQELNGE